MMTQRWPERLWIVRHGESAGNVARDAAHERGLALIDIQARDVDVPLSPLGMQQASALGGSVWWRDGAPDLNQHAVKNTPYAEWYAKSKRR